MADERVAHAEKMAWLAYRFELGLESYRDMQIGNSWQTWIGKGRYRWLKG